MNKRYQQYNKDCYLRNEFLDILSGALPIQYGRDFANAKEEFNYLKRGFDVSVHYIYYPMPLVKEFYITDWKDGFDYDRSSLHLEYWDEKWRLKKTIVRKSKPVFNGLAFVGTKERIESDDLISKEKIFPEIIKYFQEVDPNIAKQLSRNYNLNILKLDI
jgi:hypothetical protein